MRKNYPFLITLTVLFTTVFGIMPASSQQPVEYINANMVNAGLGVGGNLFSVFDSSLLFWDLYEVPQGTGKRDVYTAALWMNGIDSNGNVHCAAQAYSTTGPDFYDGPIAASYDSLYLNYYSRVFKVTQAQINYDQTLSFPANSNSLDSAILFWPGAGNPYVDSVFGVNITSGLAPFVDVDHDGIYNPMNGDYPAICGDEAVFFVFNDVRGPHHTTLTTEKLGVEVRGMAYEFIDTTSVNILYPKRAINNTVFVQYDIQNKSTLNYDSFYLALFEDPDIGCALNDYVGCDTGRNMMFAYNGTTPDPDCLGEFGYAPYQAAHGVIMLNQKMGNFLYFTNAPQTDSGCQQYYTYTHVVATDSLFGIYDSHYFFPGDPNDTNQWSEVSDTDILPPGDRRDYGSIGPMNFNAGEVKHFDFAFTTSYDSTATMNSIVDTLKRDADIVQAFYNSTVASCHSQLDTLLSINEINNNWLLVSVFPNPTNNLINIEAGETIQSLQVTDITGRLVMQQACNSTRTTMDVSNLAKGIYMLNIKSGGKFAVKKFVVE